MTKTALTERLWSILAGDVIGHDRLQLAWVVENAVELRTAGVLEAWRRDLALAPVGLAERIEQVFLAPIMEERVATSMQLIRDTLALAPTTLGIERARQTIEACLRPDPWIRP